MTRENAPSIGQICQRLEGIPLAIELAAGWVQFMSCQEIAQRIIGDLDLLHTNWSDTPTRHQSMRTVIEHSWRLLSAQEQGVLCQLAVFHNGFRYDAAAIVAGADLSILSSLVDKSWLGANDGCFTMHDLVRQVTGEKLRRQGEEKLIQVQARHSGYYGVFLHKHEPMLRSQQQLTILHEILSEIENIRVGLQWAVKHYRVDLIGQYLKSLQWVAAIRGWNQSIVKEFAQVAETLKAHLSTLSNPLVVNQTALVLAKALHCQAQHCIFLGLLTQAQDLCKESLACLASESHDPTYETESAYVKLTLGLAFFDQGQYENCECIGREAWNYLQTKNDTAGIAQSLWLLGLNNFTAGQMAEAELQLTQSLAITTHMGDLWGQAWALGMLCSLFITQGDYRQAEQCAQESYRIRHAFGDQLGIAYSLINLGEIATAQQQHASAQQLYEKALEIGVEISDPHIRGASLRELGKIACLGADYHSARRLYTESLFIFQLAGRQADVTLVGSALASIPI